jgi:hypothetical protein
MSSLLGRIAAAASGLSMLAALVGCAAESGNGGGSASCTAVIEYDGHMYLGVGDLKRDPDVTGQRLSAILPGCDDSGGQAHADSDKGIEVVELADVAVSTAVLFNGAIYVREGQELPESTRARFRSPRCATAGDFELTADWRGVTGPYKPRFDGDLRLPYQLEVHVTAGPQHYVGANIVLRATAATDPALSPADVKTTLWKGGQVVGSVECTDGDFEAVGLRAVPPS